MPSLLTLVALAVAAGVAKGASEEKTRLTILVLYDDLIERHNMDYVSFVNMSADCMSNCGFPSVDEGTPEKHNVEIVIDALLLPNATAAAKQMLCQQLTEGEEGSAAGGVSFVISLARNTDLRRMIKQVTTSSNIATIQMQHAPWTYQRYTPVNNNTADPDGSAINTTVVAPASSSPNYVTLIPPATVYLNLIYDLMMEINITKDVTILYDEILPMNDPTWRAMLKRVPLRFTYVRMETNSTLIDIQLKSLKDKTPKIESLLLISKAINVETYVMQAKDYIDENIFQWFVYTTDVSSLMCHECTSVKLFWARPNGDLGDEGRITLLKYRQETQKTEEGIDPQVEVTDENVLYASYFLDLVSLAWDFMLATNLKVDMYPSFGCYNNSLGSEDDENRTITVQELMQGYEGAEVRKATFGPWQPDDSKPNWYYVNTLGKFFQIAFELEQKQTKPTGNWTIEQGIIADYPQGLLVDVSDIHVYRIVTVSQPPFVEQKVNEKGETYFEGYCIDLMEDIQKKLAELGKPFNYTIYLANDGMYGTINDKEEWNGMIGDLVAGEAEIALGALSVMAERENYVDFTVPYYDLVGTTILMRRPDQSTSLFEFMRVLEWPVWLCIVAAYFFTSLLLWLFDKFSPYSYTNNKDKYKDDPEKREFTFKECLWFCMTSLTPQGGGEAPKNISGRLVAATWWLFGFIIIASYTANLAAFLTVSRLETNIKSLDDLYKQYKIRYAPVKGSASETYFRRMSEIEAKFYDLWKEMSLNDSMDAKERAKLAVWDYPVSDKFTNMWRFMEDSNLPETTKDGIDRVLGSSGEENGEGFAFIGDATVIKYAELTNCQLYKVGNEFSRKPYAIAVQQNSPLKDIISKAILQLLNERQLERLREKWWTENPNKEPCEKTDNESEGISIKNIGGVFIVILAGIVLSIVTLVFEYYYYKHKPMKKAKQLQAQQARNGGHTMTVLGDKANGIANGGEDLSRRGSHRATAPPYPGMLNGNGAALNGSTIRDQYSMEYNNTAFDKEN